MTTEEPGPTTESSSGGGYSRLIGLARGGMGEVELAVRSEGRFRRLYAIKRLRASLQDDDSFRTMFLDEARLAGLIRHVNVVSVLDIGADSRGPFLVLEYIEGISVQTLLTRLDGTGERLPIQLVLQIIADAAHGLHAAHELTTPEGTPLQLVHRDVSPQNILIGFDGTVRVTDFGVAKALGRTTRTESGLLKGKFGYMAPEQLRFRDLDRRSDLFALGIVLYELLTGQRLYGSDSDVPAPRRILKEPPPDVGEARSDVPPELVALVFELLAKKPTLRPSTAREVADRLETIRVKIVAEEGALNLADYLTTHFGEVRAERTAAIAEALRGLKLESLGPPPPVETRKEAPVGKNQLANAENSTVASDSAIPRSLIRRGPRWPLVAGIFAVALIGALFAAREQSSDMPNVGGSRTELEHDEQTRVEEPKDDRPGARAANEGPNERSASAPPIEPPAAPHDEPLAVQPSQDETKATRASRQARRRRQVASRRSKATHAPEEPSTGAPTKPAQPIAPPKGVDLWDWEQENR